MILHQHEQESNLSVCRIELRFTYLIPGIMDAGCTSFRAAIERMPSIRLEPGGGNGPPRFEGYLRLALSTSAFVAPGV